MLSTPSASQQFVDHFLKPDTFIKLSLVCKVAVFFRLNKTACDCEDLVDKLFYHVSFLLSIQSYQEKKES